MAVTSNSDFFTAQPLFQASILSYHLAHVAFSFLLPEIVSHALVFLLFFQSSQQEIFFLDPVL